MTRGAGWSNCCARGLARAFTLVEILIVVVILGVLAAIVIPQFTTVNDEARQATFASNLRIIEDGCALFLVSNGVWPEDGGSGTIPDGLDEYIPVNDFENGTPIGGVWDCENDDAGDVVFAVGVHFDGTGETRDDDYMNAIDAMLNDGDVETGAFRRIADARYYTVMEE
ncbi:MAG: type II secretion system protein [Planctomycetota bacterium]